MLKGKWFKRLTLFVGSALIAAALSYQAILKGWLVPKLTPDAVSQIVVPHLTVFRPDGDGPFKTVLMFHGCGGDQQQQQYWGETLKQWGFAAVYVDSYAGRGIDSSRASTKVCRGRELLGGQRAGDVLAAITWANRQAWTAKQDIVLMGWSHGAWSIMDAFAQDAAKQLPFGVSAPFASGLDSIHEVVLFYPYCGVASATNEQGWRLQPKLLTIDVAADSVVGEQACLSAYDSIIKSGSSVQQHVFDGVDHAFDVDAVSVREGRTVRSAKQAAVASLDKAKLIVEMFLQ
ncbi:dienelactone hydrolase family protein [Arenicella xantha]|uniref:Dienelactone hydrolase n=1 Tax=Arenicella xantha TaxID=644221 RepID=A0A395JIT3_9GAMM|nr:dienelactone hydrolase family protein [Arenicella xantha]RBP49679.1 dienelactone hydrolase [Arenicella xantha]